MMFLLSNNGNGEAFAALGDLAGEFYLWDGEQKYPRGRGVPKNWIWVKEDHPKVQAKLDRLLKTPSGQYGHQKRVEPVEVKQPWHTGTVENVPTARRLDTESKRPEEDTDEFDAVDIPEDEPQVFQQGDTPDDEIS